jgi:hypothetical protein
MTQIRSRKAKGRRLQNWVRDSLRGLFLTLTDDDVRVAIMGETGSDIKLSKTAKKLFPYDIECKNTEGWKKVYDAYDQADGHGEDQPLVFIKMNRRNPLVLVDAKHFMRLNNSGYITDPVKVEYMDERKR